MVINMAVTNEYLLDLVLCKLSTHDVHILNEPKALPCGRAACKRCIYKMLDAMDKYGRKKIPCYARCDEKMHTKDEIVNALENVKTVQVVNEILLNHGEGISKLMLSKLKRSFNESFKKTEKTLFESLESKIDSRKNEIIAKSESFKRKLLRKLVNTSNNETANSVNLNTIKDLVKSYQNSNFYNVKLANDLHYLYGILLNWNSCSFEYVKRIDYNNANLKVNCIKSLFVIESRVIALHAEVSENDNCKTQTAIVIYKMVKQVEQTNAINLLLKHEPIYELRSRDNSSNTAIDLKNYKSLSLHSDNSSFIYIYLHSNCEDILLKCDFNFRVITSTALVDFAFIKKMDWLYNIEIYKEHLYIYNRDHEYTDFDILVFNYSDGKCKQTIKLESLDEQIRDIFILNDCFYSLLSNGSIWLHHLNGKFIKSDQIKYSAKIDAMCLIENNKILTYSASSTNEYFKLYFELTHEKLIELNCQEISKLNSKSNLKCVKYSNGFIIVLLDDIHFFNVLK